MRQDEAQVRKAGNEEMKSMPFQLDYQRGQDGTERTGPSDRAAWVSAVIIILFILGFFSLAIT